MKILIKFQKKLEKFFMEFVESPTIHAYSYAISNHSIYPADRTKGRFPLIDEICYLRSFENFTAAYASAIIGGRYFRSVSQGMGMNLFHFFLCHASSNFSFINGTTTFSMFSSVSLCSPSKSR